MEEVSGGFLEAEDLMDLDDGDGSDLEDEEEELIEDIIPSPLQLLSSGAASTTTSTASSPPNNDDLLLQSAVPYPYFGKPLSSRRGRGRPRREGGKPIPRRQSLGSKLKRWKTTAMGFMRGLPKRVKSFDRSDLEYNTSITPPLSDEFGSLLDLETGSLGSSEKISVQDDIPYPPEIWPGKVCALCNLGERSQLGQGNMLRLLCPEEFISLHLMQHPFQPQLLPEAMRDREADDKSPRAPVTCRRQKSFNKCRNSSVSNEHIEELSIIGHVEEPDPQSVFDMNGVFFVHRNCATWSHGVIQYENSTLQNVGPAVLQSISKKCSYCNHFGASLICQIDGCSKVYHFPCATASGAFQDGKMLSTFCSQHLAHVSLLCEYSVCYTCKLQGDITNLMFCSSCGEHYHGMCVGLAQLPGVRAGWQCRKCRACQICRMVGDESKLMSCEQCDKVYHAVCLRPIVTTIPKYGWKCKCCRVCGDCGSRTPGAGLSSRWHAHYTVCDSCYQQRNKGFSCPLCHRAYRAHAYREMVQCTLCCKFVHGTCDPEADVLTYQQRKESHPEYEYLCLNCKNLAQQNRQILMKRNSIEDGDSLSASQDSFAGEEYFDIDPERLGNEDLGRTIGLGKGKPYSANKNVKQRLGLSSTIAGRPKGAGMGMPSKGGFMKKQRLVEFGRKRGSKSKMRGMFGVPGVGLQRPTSDGGKTDEEPGIENRLILCSAKDKFVLTQDICLMCGALGTDQEGCLISCIQCGQCYHPYCVNVKVTKVILQKGWRCLDCTVCEGCGQRNDESRLILCDECDISFHIYCMDPPLDYVPHGNWKCKWCAICQVCGATDPGFNSNWMNSYTECGPCASHTICPSCTEPYIEGDLIIQCVQCERWLHGLCDSIKTELEAEKCAEDGYNCILCRPRDVPPPHLQPVQAIKPPTPTKSPEIKTHSSSYFSMDGVNLTETGYNVIKSLRREQVTTRKKRKKILAATDKDAEAGIMATIESVVSGNSGVVDKLDLMDFKEEDAYKEGMFWTKEDGPPPEGFTLYTMENGVTILRRKRQRNLQKVGIGGFLVRVRGVRGTQDNEDADMLLGQSVDLPTTSQLVPDIDKPRRKPARRKPKTKLADSFPSYLQEAFFGRDLLENTMEANTTSGSEDDKSSDKNRNTFLSQDEVKPSLNTSSRQDKIKKEPNTCSTNSLMVLKEEEESDTEALKDVLSLSGDLLDNDLVDTLMNEDDEELAKGANALGLGDTNLSGNHNMNQTKDTKDELSDILGSHFNIESIPNINSKDVEDIFKNVLTDESQESQESNTYSLSTNSSNYSTNVSQPLSHPIAPPVRPTTLQPVNQSSLNSPASFPPQSPYHSEYSNSPQFSPAFSEPPSPWVTVNEPPELDTQHSAAPTSYNQRSSEKMKADESLGSSATISAVLYANINHAEWKTEYPLWNERYKQIIKKWRTLTTDQKAPYLIQARDNRSSLRSKKQQQINKDNMSSSTVSKTTTTTTIPVVNTPPIQASIIAAVSEEQEKLIPHQINSQQKTSREIEQERQWKHLQAMRQQQAQQQQHVIHEQRTQAIANVQRSLSEGSLQFVPEQGGVLQSSSQQTTPVSSPVTPTSPFYPVNPKGNQLPTPLSQSNQIKPPPSSHIVTSPAIQTEPQLSSESSPSSTHLASTPRLQFTPSRPPVQAFTQPVRPVVDRHEINHQLRDLLQRQQFKKLDEHLLPGKNQQRVWMNTETSQQEPESNNVPLTASDTTFRHPLPPGIARPRATVSTNTNILLRQPGGMIGLRLQGPDARMQGIDFKMRLLLQHQQQRGLTPQALQQFQSGATRFRPPNVDQYDQLFQKQGLLQQQTQRQPDQTPVATPPSMQQQQLASGRPDTASTDQEIPDNVTAELEKLEQETGTMVELQGVSDILGGLGEDDDELLAEMGADFNILEYADPELDSLTNVEKTNILDSLDLVEPEPVKVDKRDNKPNVPARMLPNATSVTSSMGKDTLTSTSISSATSSAILSGSLQRPSLPPPLAVSQQQTVPSAATQQLVTQPQLNLQQQLHQQMLQQVQQAAAMGRPMAPGTKLMSPDGVIGIVTANNNVTLTFPAQRILSSHLQQLQNQKLQMRVGAAGQQGPRMFAVPSSSAATGAIQSAILAGLSGGPRMSLPSPAPPPPPPPPPYPGPPPPYPGSTSSNQEQPLLLEDLLEQEKREQEKQLQTQNTTSSTQDSQTANRTALLSDHDFERLKADVFNSSNIGLNSNIQQNVQAQVRTNFTNIGQWQQNQTRPKPISTPQPVIEAAPQVQTFNVTLLPAPPLPPENIVTEQDRQLQVVYEQWLNNQNAILSQQLKYYETEVQKLRKVRKSLNTKQRQLRKTGNQLADVDALELQRISSEQAVLQKHLESSRKQSRQHGMLIQEYRNKQQSKQRAPVSGTGQQLQSPLGPPASSPIHPPQSPLMSPSASPMMVQHNSPLQSPGPVVSHSPVSVIHSPSNQTNNMSPRIGTPHSIQSEGSPGPVQSPSQVCLPPPVPRMTSPQHRRIVTSPVTYQQAVRFARPPLTPEQQARPRLITQTIRPGTASSPQQIHLTPQQHQQLLQRQAFMQQQGSEPISEQNSILQSQRAIQLIQQRQQILRQQQQQQAVSQPQPLTPQQHQLMVQQQQQLAKQQQQQIAQNARIISQQPPSSPMTPRSPMIMSPHSIHSQPTSPMLSLNPPNSPLARSMGQPPNSPMLQHHQQPPQSPILQQSPIGLRRPPSTSSSPIMPDRPLSVENPSTPRTPYTPPSFLDNDYTGGGNPHNPHNPIPFPFFGESSPFGRYGFFKLGLHGGSPMWALGNCENKDEKPGPSELPKIKKEPHLNKVSILKKKTFKRAITLNKVNSLVSSDYNEFEDSSCTPPVTPPPGVLQKMVACKKSLIIDNSPDQKHEVMDYDDDTVVSTEVSLNSVAQQADNDDVIETFSQSDLVDTISSPLQSGQMGDEFLLFPVDISNTVQEEDEEYGSEIVNVAIQSPTPSEEELIMHGHTKKVTSDGLTLNIVQGLSSNQLLTVTDAPDSPEQEEHMAHSPEAHHHADHDMADLVLMGSSVKSPEIATAEDFEKLIDEGTRKEKILKQIVCPTKTLTTPQIAFIPGVSQNAKLTSDVVITRNAKLPITTTGSLASLILPINTSVSPAITIVNASSASRFTIPVISASAISKLPNVKVIDKPSSSISLAAQDSCLPRKIFEDESSVSPDSSTCDDEKSKLESQSDSSILDKFDHSSEITITKMDKPKKFDIANIIGREHIQRLPSPVISKASSPVMVQNTPELKMTAQIVQEKQLLSQQSVECTNYSDTDSKSVVISIPSPTPSQEQMLDNMALQAMETRRREGKFDTFEDVLDMIENITGEPPTLLESASKTENKLVKAETQMPVTISTSIKQPPVMPQLSPLSQPNDLTTNMANVSQQLRTLLSSLHTTTVTTSPTIKNVSHKVITSNTSVIKTPPTNLPVTTASVLLKATGIQLIQDLPKKQVPVVTTAVSKSSLSLNAMLQSHPAATVPQTAPGTITTASILGSPIALTKSSFTPSLVHAQPLVVSPTITTNVKTAVSSSNLLHSHLTKLSKPVEDIVEVKKEEPKRESPDIFGVGCKFSTIQNATTNNKMEDSQNVLLKQLLQNTGCATTQPQPAGGPSLPVVPNLEAQLARPVSSTPTSLLPPLIQNEPKKPPTTLLMSRETSFLSKPIVAVATSQQLHIDVKKCLPPSRTPSRDELLSPPTPRSTCSQDSNLQTPPLSIKKELLTPQEVKKEFDESSQHSEVSDHSRTDIKEEMIDPIESIVEKTTLEQKEEIKKMKRRAYQQKRRLNLMNKELGGHPKKRPRKNSKLDEDYDTYIEGILAQLRALPPMVVQEPQLSRNYGIAPIFGIGDLSKLSSKDYNLCCGELVGSYGKAVVPGFADFYSSKPYGDIEPLPEKPPASTQRGFYDQEFSPIKFDADEDRKFELFCRDNDTPDSVISSSSPECTIMDPYAKFLGLKLIDEDDDDEEEDEALVVKGRLSPIVPIIAPIPIRLKPIGPYLKDYAEMDKENECKDYFVKSKYASNLSAPLKDSGNVTVTLTLTSSAAENIMGVLKDLANILHIPPPTSYQIVERTSTPPGQKLGLYRTKGKDGKEGAPIDIQSILNGAAKFCRHCDVVIINNLIRKKVADLPFLSKDTELLCDGDELFFCSTACYMQFAIMHRSPSISQDKAAAAIVDHLSQKDTSGFKKINYPKDGSLFNFKKEFDINSEGFAMRMGEFDFKSRKQSSPYDYIQPAPPKIWKGLKYKSWVAGCLQPKTKYKKPTDKEIMELLYRLGITLLPSKMPEDTRKCMFCQLVGDGVADGPARLLNFDVDKWVHLNCALWSDGVYETVNGALMHLETAIQQSLVTNCILCTQPGATIRCFKTRCSNIYHLPCAVKDGCVFYKNKTLYCASHILKNEKDSELTTLSVSRRVYVNRDENRQVAAIMHHASDTNNLLRVGSLIFLNVGQILPHQLQNFHTSNYIYPIGYKIVRFYWSMRRLNKRCRYVCSIHDSLGRPEFRVVVQEPPEEDVEYRDSTPKGAWNKILEALAVLRKESNCLQVFPRYLTGEDLFGLTEPAVVRVLESLPGIETLSDYKFKYGRNPLLELPLAINPSGAARTEPKLRNQFHWKRTHTQRTSSSVRPTFVPTVQGIGETICPYSKQFVHSKSSQYKKMKQEWRNNVFLARSKIQGLGLYAARDLEKHTMVIEYIGEIIRTELAEMREKKYEDKNRGIYMFRLDEDRVIDATLSGGLARYINHSCNPNCVAEIVEVDRDLRIIIFAKRRIQRGEELAYDYKFEFEDDQHKISCMCGAPNCRKWMN